MPSKPGVSSLLIATALDPDLRRRLAESPESIFEDYDLTAEEQDLLRHPDHRLLPLLGMALAEQSESSGAATPAATPAAAPQPHAIVPAQTLPDVSLALTLVPCAQYENGRLNTLSYAVWVSPLPEGADPATLPPPPGATLPGQPLTPLYAVVQVSVSRLEDAAGTPRISLHASLRQSSNVSAPPPPEAAGKPGVSPFGSDLDSPGVRAAVALVRNASSDERYDRVIDLMRALRGGDVR